MCSDWCWPSHPQEAPRTPQDPPEPKKGTVSEVPGPQKCFQEGSKTAPKWSGLDKFLRRALPEPEKGAVSEVLGLQKCFQEGSKTAPKWSEFRESDRNSRKIRQNFRK